MPFGRYYGTVDATPLFVLLAGDYARTHRRLSRPSGRLWPNDRSGARPGSTATGDLDGDGFVRILRSETTEGLANQGWKDVATTRSSTPTAALAEGPIALAEVQAYVFAAPSASPRGARAATSARWPRVPLEQGPAQRVRARFEAAFWCDELGTYALALDGDEEALPGARLQCRPCAVERHRVARGRGAGRRRPAVGRASSRAGASAPWRTGEARYNPMSYHNGSVWPHDNALIASGFARYGFDSRAAAELFEGFFAAASYMDLRRLPELFCGFSPAAAQAPTLYPVACSPQAWASAAHRSALLEASLGLELEHERNRSGWSIRCCRHFSW